MCCTGCQVLRCFCVLFLMVSCCQVVCDFVFLVWCCACVCVFFFSKGLICCAVFLASRSVLLPALWSPCHQPKVLQGLNASWYIDKPGRARGLRCSIPSFSEAETESSACAKTKAMMLTVRAVSCSTNHSKIMLQWVSRF